MSLQHRLAQSEEVSSKTDNERLFDTYQEGCRLEREGVRIKKECRPEIDSLMESGELVGYPDAHLSLQERTTLSADMDELAKDLGVEIALRVASVDSTKLKKLIDAGVIREDAPYVTKTVATSLVTKTNR